MNNIKQQKVHQSFSNDLQQVLFVINKNWYLFAISIFLSILIAFFYLRYNLEVYNVKSKILIEVDGGTSITNNELLTDLNLFSGNVNLNNEIGVISSYSTILKTIGELDFDVSYFVEGNVRKKEVYHSLPIIVSVDTLFNNPKGVPFHLTIISDSTIKIEAIINKIKIDSIINFNRPCKHQYFSFTIFNTGDLKSLKNDDKIYFIINDKEQLAQKYYSSLDVVPAIKNSSILELSISGPILAKEISFINKLAEVYIKSDLEQKNKIARNTLAFIDEQLMNITDSLGDVEGRLERFRYKEKMMDLNSTALNSFNKLNELEKERAILIVKHKYYDYLLDYLSNNYEIEKLVAPSVMGIDDPLLLNLINELYKHNADRVALGFSAKGNNPSFRLIETKIENTKKALIENVKNILAGSNIALKDNQERVSQISSMIDKLPNSERNLVNIQRKYNLNDHIYNYLLEKRTEIGISKAGINTSIRIVDSARLDSLNPGKPNRRAVYLAALFIGLFIPSIIIFIKQLLNDTIISKEQVERLTSVPLLGMVGHNSKKRKLPILEAPKSFISESLRSIRINMQYINTENSGSKVIGVTSSISGEGKTFFSINLATTIAITGAKVILIGADLRKPKLAASLNITSPYGLTNYLAGKASIDEIIENSSIEGLKIISSGPMPPNPSELLSSKKLLELIEKLKKDFDYIVIDTPPIGLVSDYYLISKVVDTNLFIVRFRYTKINLLKELNSLHETNRINNLYLVLNDAKEEIGNYGYGYGYGYGYYDESNKNKNWYTNFLKILKKHES